MIEGLGPHLGELRKRLVVSFTAVLACAVAAFLFSEEITRFFMTPLFRATPELGKLIYTNLTEAFVAYIKVALLVGVLASSPVLLQQLWLFVAPGLYKKERRVFSLILFFSTGLFLGGAAFAYFAVLPTVLRFLMGFSGEMLEPLPRLDAYLAFVARTAMAFGLAFEIPFLMVATTKLGLVSKAYFRTKRKYYYLAIFILSTLLTGGDLFSAVMLAGPLFGLYEAGVIVIRIF